MSDKNSTMLDINEVHIELIAVDNNVHFGRSITMKHNLNSQKSSGRNCIVAG